MTSFTLLLLVNIVLPVEFFFKHVGYSLSVFRETCEKFFLAADFKTEEAEPCLSEFLTSFDYKSFAKNKTCFTNPENTRCIDLLITNSAGSFQKSTEVASGLCDFHKTIVAICKTYFQKYKPKEILYRNVLRLRFQSIKRYKSFEQVFLEVTGKKGM